MALLSKFTILGQRSNILFYCTKTINTLFRPMKLTFFLVKNKLKSRSIKFIYNTFAVCFYIVSRYKCSLAMVILNKHVFVVILSLNLKIPNYK